MTNGAAPAVTHNNYKQTEAEKRSLFHPPVNRDNLEAQYKYRRKSQITLPTHSNNSVNVDSDRTNTKIDIKKQSVPGTTYYPQRVATESQHVVVSTVPSAEPTSTSVKSDNAEFIRKKFFNTMNPNFHQSVAEFEVDDDTDNVVRDISEEDERRADKQSAFDYYMKMSKEATPSDEEAASKDTPSDNSSPRAEKLGLGIEKGYLMRPGESSEASPEEQHIGRPIGLSPQDVLLSKRGSVAAKDDKSAQMKEHRLKGVDAVASKRGPKSVKKKIAASKRRLSQSNQSKLLHDVNSQLESMHNSSSQSKSKSKLPTASNNATKKKEILEIVDLNNYKLSSAFRSEDANTMMEKDDLILNYAKRYKDTGRLVADFSKGPEHAKLFVYNLGETGSSSRRRQEKRDGITTTTSSAVEKSKRDFMMKETMEGIEETLRRSGISTKTVDENAEKRMIGMVDFFTLSRF